MYGGGGFGDGGASQFNGAGFMPSQGNAGGGGASAKKSYDSKAQSLRAVTVKQLYDVNAARVDDNLLLDGRELSNITLVGKVLSTAEQGVTYALKVNDGTGSVDVKLWISDEDTEIDKQRRAEWRPGVYVRVHGHMNCLANSTEVVAFNVRLVADFNEVTYHFLQCIFQHVHLTKGGGGAAGAGADAGFKQEQGGYGAPAGGYGGPPAAGGYNPASGLSGIHKEIMTLFNAPDAMSSDAGISIDDVLARSGGRYSVVQVREAIEALQNDGQLYSTIDEYHFKSCNV